VGDPFLSSTSKIDTRGYEQEVLHFWAEQLRAPKNNWWGYVNNGGTEGNLYGLYLARELHPKGMVYFSQDTHYSVNKIVHVLNMRNIMIRSRSSGEIDYDDLEETLKNHRDTPPIIFANIGTTMTEAKDDIRRIKGILEKLAIRDYYIHSYAAMSGAIIPFSNIQSPFDFADGADSISISGHKFIGSPIPCGMVFAKKHNVDRISRSIAYIGTIDSTISGSRSGFTPLILWQAIQKHGIEGMRKRVSDCQQLAQYTCDRLRQLHIDAWLNPGAITVVLPEPDHSLIEKWQLATSNGRSHIILAPGVEKARIDLFLEDVLNCRQVAKQGQ
jgi:histidine decarboxylase